MPENLQISSSISALNSFSAIPNKMFQYQIGLHQQCLEINRKLTNRNLRFDPRWRNSSKTTYTCEDDKTLSPGC